MPSLPPYTIGPAARDSMARENIAETEVIAALQQWWGDQRGQPAPAVHLWSTPVHGLVVSVEYRGPGSVLEVINAWRSGPFSAN